MKLIILLLTVAFLQVSARGVSQSISFSGREVPLTTVFQEVKKQTGLLFFYDRSVLEGTKPVTIKAINLPLVDFLNEVFKDQPLKFIIESKTITISRKPATLAMTPENADPFYFPPIDIKGKIVDEAGEPVVASIVVKGTKIGTTSKADGSFELRGVDDNATLVLSGVNIDTKEILIDGKKNLAITVSTRISTQREVVVTAFGVGKSRKSITYATQNVSSEEVTKVKDPSFVNALAGKVAGALITKGNFGPGSPTKILMRGDKSFIGNSEPLYVIDGAPMFGGSDLLANINPEDIESLQVMTGASAAALYGSQAANGVVLVTTKKGKNGAAKINFSSQFTVEKAVDLPELQTTYGQTDPKFNDSWGEKITNGSDAHLEEFFQPGTTLINALSVSNGNELAQIYLSYANTTAKGILPHNDLSRNNFTIRGTTQLLDKKLTLDGSVNYTNQKVYNQNSAGGYSALPGIFSFPTGDDFSKYSKDKFEVWDPLRQMNVQNWPYIRNETFPNQNPYWVQNRNQNDFFRDHTITSFTAKYKLNKWLNVQGRGIYDRISDHYESRQYATTQATVAGANGGYGLTESDIRYFYSDLLLMANKQLGDDFSLAATIGLSSTKTTATSVSVSSTVPTSLTFPNYFSIFALNGLFNKSESERNTLSRAVFGNATLGFREKLFLDVTARKEWSSTVTQSFFYPSAGLSYIAVNNPSAKGLSFAKFRGSLAEVGNSLPFGIQNWTPPYSLDNSGNINGRGSLPFFDGTDTINLKPERTRSFEFGTDLNFLNNRLNINLTYYNATTYDQVFQIQAPAGAGATNFWINGGTIRNQGIEGIISYSAKLGKVNWRPSLNFSSNKNQILELSDLLKADYFALGGSYREVSLFLTRPKDGQYGSYGDLFGKVYLKDDKGQLIIGDNGLPTVSASFENYLGNANPKFLAGFNNNFSYNRITASFLIDARFGGNIYNRTEQWLDYKGLSKRTGDARDAGGVMVEGKLVDTKAFYMNQTGAGAGGAASGNLYDVTNVRLRELAVGYTFEKFKGIEVSLSLVGRNLFFFYKNAPFDPEISANTSQTSEGISSFTMPQVRSFGFSLNATF